MEESRIIPNQALRGVRPYSGGRDVVGIDLWLDANEGATPAAELLTAVRSMDTLRRYPTTDALRGVIASRLGVGADHVAVTAGGDDAIDRACRGVLGPDKEIILTPPTFEMFERYAALNGATAVEEPWAFGPFPTDRVLARITPGTAAIAMVTPNNPTGLVATAEDVRRISAAAPGALVILDLAYTEYADVDLQATALALPNVVAIRTLSKAWGLAGLRVGYAVGSPDVINWIRAAGGPFAVSGPAAAIAQAVLQNHEEVMTAHVARVRQERAELFALLKARGLDPWPSQANFVTTRAAPRSGPLASQLAKKGIAVRSWKGRAHLPEPAARITCPGDAGAFERLTKAIGEICG